MNIVEQIDCEPFVRADRTVEVYLLANQKRKCLLYVYNREGLYYYVYKNIADFIESFLPNQEDNFLAESLSSEEMDKFLEDYEIPYI